MLFDLEVLSNGEKKIIRFDNERNLFFNPETDEPYLAEHRTRDYRRYSPIYDIKKNDIGVLFINLGLNCNFSCKYCHQNKFRHNTKVENSTPKKAADLLEKLKRSKLKPKAIALWGGEPLVYWKTMKVLIPGLRELYPDTKINFPTNGALLNSEILNFLTQYDVGFYISYDGKTTNRDESIFDNPQLVADLKKFGKKIDIMPTQNRASIPIDSIRKEFDDMKIGLSSVAIYSIARCNPWNREYADEIRIPKEKGSTHSEFIYRAIRQEVENPELYKGLNERFNHIALMFYQGLGIDSEEVHFCSNCTGRDVCIDVNGTIFSCMNIPLYEMGDIETFNPFNATHIYQNHLYKEECMECPFVTCCRGGVSFDS